MEIKPAYVTFEQAKILVEKGANLSTSYNEHCDEKEYYHKQTGEVKLYSYFNVFENMIPIPQQWQVVEWLRVKHGINVEANRLSNIGKYRWLAIPMNIIPKSFKTKKEYLDAVYKYYGKENFDTPQEAYSAAFDYVFKNLI